MRTTGTQSKTATRTRQIEETVKVKAKKSAQRENSADAKSAVFSALQPKSKCAFQVCRVAMQEYCFAQNTSVDEQEETHGLETNGALYRILNLVLADPSYSTRSMQDYASSAPDMPSQGNTKDAAELMSIVTALKAQENFFCSELPFFHRNKGLRLQTEMIEDGKADGEGSKEGFRM